MLPQRYFEPMDRIQEVVYGLMLLTFAALFGYFGINGALAYVQGSRAAPSDPLACGIGIFGGMGMGYLAIRLLTGWRVDQALIPNTFLLAGGVSALIAAVWFVNLSRQLGEPFTETLDGALFVVTAGVGALVLWWRRVRGRAHKGKNAA